MKERHPLSGLSLFSILSVAFVWLFEASAIGPALGAIAQAFPDASELQIKNVMTVPFFTSIVFSVISGWLATKVDKKWILIVGLGLYGVTGALPAYATSIDQIIVLRLLTGVGVGLVLPITNIYLSEHFDGAKRDRMLGLALLVANSANVLNSIIMGILQTYSWKYPFLAFLVVLLIMLLVIVALPRSPVRTTGHRGSFSTLPAGIYANALYMTFLWVLFAVVVVNCALFMISEQIGEPWMIGFAVACPAIGSMVSAGLFPEFKARLGNMLVPLCMLVFAGGFLCLYLAPSISLVVAGCLLIGVGQGAIVANLFARTAAKVTSDEQKDAAFGIVNACIHVGMLISPFAQEAFLSWNSATSAIDGNHFRVLFLVSAVVILFAAAAAFLFGRSRADELRKVAG